MARRTAHRDKATAAGIAREQNSPDLDRSRPAKQTRPTAGDRHLGRHPPSLPPLGYEFTGTNYSPDPSLPLTSTGYPLASAGTYANIANYPDGLYQVSYQGTATLSFLGVGQLTTPPTLGSDGLYHAVLTVNHSWLGPYGPYLYMQVTGLNTANPFGNLRIITPGYGTNTTQEFTNAFLQDLAALLVCPDDGVD